MVESVHRNVGRRSIVRRESDVIDCVIILSEANLADLVARGFVPRLDQCAEIGDLHHAIAAGLLTRSDVHAELAEVIEGTKAGRASAEEIVVFDSTGTALEDVAAAAAVYEKALKEGRGRRFSFAR